MSYVSFTGIEDAEADYNDWFLAFEALSKNGEELQKIRDAAWQARSDAFDALMDAKEARFATPGTADI